MQEQGAFARPVRTDERNTLTRPEFQVHPTERVLAIGIAVIQTANPNCRRNLDIAGRHALTRQRRVRGGLSVAEAWKGSSPVMPFESVQGSDGSIPSPGEHGGVDSLGPLEGPQEEHAEHAREQPPGQDASPLKRTGAASLGHAG